MNNERHIINQSMLSTRITFTLIILTIFIIGRNIPLPLVDVEQSINNSQFFETISMATGGDIANLSIFLLGIGPYMSMMILWRFITLGDFIDERKMPSRIADRWKNILTLIIAIIQSLGILSNVQFNQQISFLNNYWLVLMVTCLFSVSGTFFLIWLGNKNALFGFGNTTIIILAGIILKWVDFIKELFYIDSTMFSEVQLRFLLFLGCWIVFIFITSILVELSEQRVPLHRITLSGQFANDSYLPIKLNPAGGLPIMYALIVMSLPQYLFQALTLIIPNNKVLQYLILHLQMSDPLGVITYACLIFGLGIGFAFVNISPRDLAENLQKSGDYIANVPSGKPTYDYLTKKVGRIAFVGATWLTIATTVPWIIGLLEPSLSEVSTLVANVVILVSIVGTIIQEIQTVYIRKQYASIL
ncbi:accessory Sec system protein translocase subunit SecY2 [Vagococcus lutrae]|uniref:accessory Sec system protein translocase subunit SecY2 n=1 Tax=Vagococcus lutrae TaxID=81947 RepID=UPI00288E14FD|nr:accessory Sec system protein translocase subunit SecY2 [Vagococcus lutrae]MDT2808501.1 accessory Sec system protein translocase subunit SecY2 [Vagococcus lutrae]